MSQITPVPGPSQADFDALNGKIAKNEIQTGITKVTAIKTGYVVELFGNDIATAVTAGGYVTLGTLPNSLKPAHGLVYGVASAGFSGGRKMGAVTVDSSGNLIVEASEAMTISYFSICYIANQ